MNACLPGIPQHFTENEREIHMSSLVPFDNISMVWNGILHSSSIHVILDFLLNPKVLIIASKKIISLPIHRVFLWSFFFSCYPLHFFCESIPSGFLSLPLISIFPFFSLPHFSFHARDHNYTFECFLQ